MSLIGAGLKIVFFVCPLTVLAQGNYEIQVYGSDTVPAGSTMVELHSNWTAQGSKVTQDGTYATNHQVHETVEITQGWNSWFETGFYIFTSHGPGNQGYQWIGDHIRPRVRVPDSWKWPVGVSLSMEIGYQQPGFSRDTWTWEIRPIIDKQIGRWYMAFNPALERSWHGPGVPAGLEFAPAAKVSCQLHKRIAGGIEYYGATGPVKGFAPIAEQQHQIFPALDVDLGPAWEFNFGVGIGTHRNHGSLDVQNDLGTPLRLLEARACTANSANPCWVPLNVSNMSVTGRKDMNAISVSNEQQARSLNPATGELVEEFPFQSDIEVEALLGRAQSGQKVWRTTGFSERGRILNSVAKRLRAARSEFASTITLEMGKPITEAEAEIEKCAWNCEYVAENGEQWLKDEEKDTNAAQSYVSFLPMGTILAVMPWNFPFWQVFRFAVPALMAGNAVVLKHAPNVMRCARSIERVFTEAGLPSGVFQNAIVPVDTVGRMLADPRIAAATVTGSPKAGAAVAEQCGRALKKVVLELGGSDAFIVLPDADLDQAIAAAVRGRFANCGQVCLAPKRFILTRETAAPFRSLFAEAVQQLRTGDPLDRATQLGPMAREDLREELDRQVQSSVSAGARVLAGGSGLPGKGYFYRPTVLADVSPKMAVGREETFGPVAALFEVENAEEALELANSSDYGLSANIWTRDIDRVRSYARQIATGSVFINGVATSDPRLPIGGVKRSGFGRELAVYGIREFVNIQTVWIGPPKQPVLAPKSSE